MDKLKAYLKILISINLQIYEINHFKKNFIKNINSPLKYCLVNKDIIDNYLQTNINSLVIKEIEELKNKNELFNSDDSINSENLNKIMINIFNIIKERENEFPEPSSIQYYLETEKLKINEIEYPYNFFIIKKKLLDLILGKSDNKDNNISDEDKRDEDSNINENNIYEEYNTLIGKEGIFIWKSIPQVKKPTKNDKKKQNIIIYCLYCNNDEMEIKDFKINKIFLFNNEEEFINEFQKNISGKNAFDYFTFRNIKNKIGFFNIIDDGIIIGRYINIIKSDNFEDIVEEEDDDDIDMNPSLNNLIRQAEDKDKTIEYFLKHLLVNLYYIKDFLDFINDIKMKNIINEENNKNDLIYALSELFINYDNKDELKTKINNFIEIFKKKSLGENISFNSNIAFQNIIKKVINEFHKEINFKKEENLNYNQTFSNLFYGEKEIINNNNYIQNNEKEKFSSIYTDPEIFKEENKAFHIKEIMNLKIWDNSNISLSKILILILYNNGAKFMPSKLIIDDGNNKYEYKLLSCIQNLNDDFWTIIPEKKYKISFDKENNYHNEDNCEVESEISKSLIFFYKLEKKVKLISQSFRGSIYSNSNILNTDNSYSCSNNIYYNNNNN